MSMTEEQAVELITQRFIDQWPIEQPTVPYGFEGEPEASADKFVSVIIQHTPLGGQMTQGTHPRIVRTGRIWVKLWSPAIATAGAVGGTKARAQLADSARKVFERQALGSTLTEQLQIRTGTTVEGVVDGRWLISAVVLEFRYYVQV